MSADTPRTIDRSDAVNLSSNIISRRDTGSYAQGVTDKGMKMLCDAVLTMDRELAAEQEKCKMLREALAHMLGPIDDEKVGWRGRNPPTNDHFGCEFCAKSHLDCTLIEHQDDCPVTIARATLEATKP